MIKKIFAPIKRLLSRVAASGDALAYAMIAAFVFAGPLFFVPVRGYAVGVGKGFLAMFLGLILLLIGGVVALKKGVLTVPRSPFFAILGGIWIVALVGSVLSPSAGMSIAGYGFETTTWLFLTVFAACIAAAYQVLREYRRVGVLFGLLFASFAVIFVFHLVRFIGGPSIATLGVLGGNTSTLIGSWGDLGMFFGMVLLLSTLTLELAGLARVFKWGVAGIAAASGIALAFMNIGIVWIVLGSVSLLVTLYLFAFAYWDTSSKSYKKENRVPWYVLGLFVFSIICLFFGPSLGSLASRHQNISWNDVRPSFTSSVQVAGKNLVHNFATGYGPNTFSLGWSLAKPVALSGGTLSGADFSQGYSYGMTQVATGGVLGAMLWIAFFLTLGYLVVRRMGKGFESSLDRYFAVSIAVLVIYLSAMSWVYVPGTYLLIILALLIGAFVSVSKTTKESSFSFIKDPRASFFGILGLTAILVVILFAGYVEARKASSFSHYAKANSLVAKSDLPGAVGELTAAIRLASHDIYHYQMAQLALGDAARAASSVASAGKDAATKQAEQSLGIALGHAKAATDQNPMNYRNWSLTGDVYRAAVSLGVSEALDLAKKAYAEADLRNPNDSTSLLAQANLSLASKDASGALGFVKQSIDRYPTAAAYGTRAQIQIGQQDWSGTLDSLKRLISLGSSDPLAYIYLGVAYEKTGDAENAAKVYDMIRKRFTDGDEAISKVKAGLEAGSAPAAISQDAPAVPAAAAAPVPQKAAPKTPVAPKAKK